MEIRTVLCPVDFTSLSDKEIDLAARVSQRFGARLIIEHNLSPCLPPSMGVSWMWSQAHEGDLERCVNEATVRLRRLIDSLPDSLQPEAKLTRGPVDEALLHLARRLPADLIVMGSHGRSSPEHASVTERVLARSPCPVLTTAEESAGLPPLFSDPPPQGQGILVPVDFSSYSLRAAAVAFALMRTFPHRLTLLHVDSASTSKQDVAARDPWGRSRLDRLRARLEELVPRPLADRVECHVITGRPVDQVLAHATRTGAALLIVGCHRKGRLRRLVSGCSSHEILHRSDCPVWFIPTSCERGVASLGVAS